MNSEGNAEKKKGRKRQTNDESLSPTEREKREKNRQAAQKCREKKERLMTELRNKNHELRQENAKLHQEKERLSKIARSYKAQITDHCKKGCKISERFTELWEMHKTNTLLENLDESFSGFWDSEEPAMSVSSPSYSLDDLSLSMPSESMTDENYSDESLAPKALFSGTPLVDSQINRGKAQHNRSKQLSTSSSSSSKTNEINEKISSSSLNNDSLLEKRSTSSFCLQTLAESSLPSTSSHSSIKAVQAPQVYKNLSHYLTSSKLPAALAPISTGYYKNKESSTSAACSISNSHSAMNSLLNNDRKVVNDSDSNKSIHLAERKLNSLGSIQSSHISQLQLVEINETVENMNFTLSSQCESDSVKIPAGITKSEDNQNLSSLDALLDIAAGIRLEIQQEQLVDENNLFYLNEINENNVKLVIKSENSPSLFQSNNSFNTLPKMSSEIAANLLQSFSESQIKSTHQNADKNLHFSSTQGNQHFSQQTIDINQRIDQLNTSTSEHLIDNDAVQAMEEEPVISCQPSNLQISSEGNHVFDLITVTLDDNSVQRQQNTAQTSHEQIDGVVLNNIMQRQPWQYAFLQQSHIIQPQLFINVPVSNTDTQGETPIGTYDQDYSSFTQ